MKLVSPLLKRLLYPSISITGLFHHTSSKGLAIVTYHGVMPEGYQSLDPMLDGNLVTAGRLREQLRLLKRHYNVISPQHLLAWRKGECSLPPRAALLTCDDGLLNCLTDMLPVLQQEELRCLFFVTGASTQPSRTMLWYEELLLMFLKSHKEHLNISFQDVSVEGELRGRKQRRSLWWHSVKILSKVRAEVREAFLREARTQLGLDTRPDLTLESGSSCRRFGLMNIAELHQLASAGMTIGAHTLDHPVLSQSPAPMAYEEIAESRSKLESGLGTAIWAFAYPFGDSQSVTAEVLAMPQSAGFVSAFLNTGGGLGTSLPEFALPRVHVTADMSLGEFEAHVSGFYAWVQRCAGRASLPSVFAQA